MKTRKKREKGWYKPYILFELLAILVMFLISVVLFVGVRRQVTETNEATAYRLSEMCYDNNVTLASREALQFIRTIEMSKGYEGNVAASLTSGVDDIDFWIEGDVLITGPLFGKRQRSSIVCSTLFRNASADLGVPRVTAI